MSISRRLASGGLIDRSRPLNFTFDGKTYGGFKATPGSGFVFAHLLARDEPHPAANRLLLDRFRSGHIVDEKGQGAQPNLH